MKKVIIAFDNASFSESALDFAVRLNQISPILLTGVFLPQSEISALWSYAGAVPSGLLIPLVEPESSEEVKTHIDIFSRICEHNDIDYKVHKDFNNFSIQELVRESRFADLILLGGNSFYQKITDKTPNMYIRQVLHDVECPVMLLPQKAAFPGNNILSYDGSANCVFAIKQFAYLFPEFSNKRTSLIYINNKSNKALPEKVNIEELVSRHFPDLEIMHLTFDAKKYLASWLVDRPASIFIAGSYGRSGLSRLFAPSAIDNVITSHSIPIFIAHR